MELLSVVLAILAGALIIYYLCFYPLKRFKDAGIIYKKPIPIIGNLGPSVLHNVPISGILTEAYNMNPDAKYVGFFEMWKPIIMIRDAELLKEITVKSFEHFCNHEPTINELNDPIMGKNLFSLRDQPWRKMRVLVSPVFTAKKLKLMFNLMLDCAENYAEYFVEQPPGKTEFEMKETCTRYANDIIATCAFGISTDSMRNPKNRFWDVGQNITQFNILRSLILFVTRDFPVFSRYLGLHLVRNRDRTFFKNTIESAVRSREEKGTYRPDLIQLMIETRNTGQALTMDEMVGQSFIFYFAGFDTVSTMLSFVMYEVASNPEIYKKLQDEVDRVNESCNGKITYDIIMEMTYLEAVINETLRFHTPSNLFDRECMSDYELPPALPGGKPYMLRKGDIIWCPIYAIHHDPKYFEEPDTFNPERFLQPDRKGANEGMFIPFGHGPRMCVGVRFTMLETKLFMFKLLTKCRISTCARTPNPLVLYGLHFSMRVKNGLWLDIRARKTNEKPAEAVTSNNVRA